MNENKIISNSNANLYILTCILFMLFILTNLNTDIKTKKIYESIQILKNNCYQEN